MNIAALKREMDLLTIAQVTIVVSMLTFFLLTPVIFMIIRAFNYNGNPSLYYFQSLIQDPDFIKFPPELTWYEYRSTAFGDILIIGRIGPDFGLILNTIFISAMVSLFSLILGVISAFIMARYNFPGKNIFRVMLLIPILATPFVNAYIIGKVLGTGGLLNYILHDFLKVIPFRILITGIPAVILIQTLSFFPIVYLNSLSSFINIDPSLEEQAENLGASGFKLFRTVTFPLALPGISAGAALVFIFSMEDLGAPIGLSGAFGEGLHQKIMSFYVYDEFRRGIGTIEQVHPSIYAIAVLMLTIAIIIFLMIKKYVSMRSYAMLSKGGRWSPRVRRLGLKGSIAATIFLLMVSISASFPQIGVVILALTNWAISGTLPTRFTLEFLSQLAMKRDVIQSITNSLFYSSIATFFMVLVGTSAAYVISRRKIPGRDALDVLVTMPVAIPGIIVAVGYLLFFATTFSLTPLDPFINPGLLLIFSYSVRRLPFSARSIFAGFQQVHVSLEEAALNLGASRVRTFFTIAIPLIITNVLSGSLLSLVYSMNEVSTSITLSNLNPSQGPITYYMSRVIYASGAVGTVSVAAALGILLMIAQVISISISNYIFKQKVAFLGV